MGKRIEAIEKPKAKRRQRDHGGTAPGKPSNTSGNLPEVKKGQTRDKVAASLGISGSTYENTCRLNMDPTEIYELGMKIEEIERPEAKRRQGARTDLPQHSGKLPGGSAGQTRDKVAAAVGISGKTYDKIKQIAGTITQKIATYAPIRTYQP